MLDPNTMLDLRMPAGAFDIVMRALAEQPYRSVAPIIDMLKQQVLAEHPHAFDQQPFPSPPPPKPNGAAEEWRTVQESR